MNYNKKLKERIKSNAKRVTLENNNFSGIERESAYIFDNIKMNFNRKSFDNINQNNNWRTRLEKRHSHFDDGTLEMQSSNSSDALLMNIFCYPKISVWLGPSKLLGVDFNNDIIFGWNPLFENEDTGQKTEIDLKIGNIIFEAKLTESSFTAKDIHTIRKYPGFYEVFDESNLTRGKNNLIKNYQLIRNVLTIYKYGYNFKLLIDEARIDLIHAFYNTINAIKLFELRKRIDFITWQELVKTCGKELKEYIYMKYF